MKEEENKKNYYPIINIIVAATLKRGIGFQNKIPWKLPSDLHFFSKITSQTKDEKKKNVCIMGRKTYFSIPEKFRPLKNRFNIVLTRNKETFPMYIFCYYKDKINII